MNNKMLVKDKKTNNNIRGQAAIEFLVTYGWAIMAAMLVIGALTYFGITNPATSLPDKCIFSNAFECKDFKINGTSTGTTVQLQLINTAGQTLYGTGASNTINASMTDKTSNSECTVAGTIKYLEPEETLNITCINPPDYPFNTGEKAKTKITITYAKNPSGYTQISLGEVYSTVQKS
jgi:hypothetical protein